MLSVRSVLPSLPMVAALSANHLAALLFRVTLRRLYVVRDNDLAGAMAVASLTERAQAAGIEALTLSPALGDFNEDLRRLGLHDLRAALRAQLVPDDVARFMSSMDAADAGDQCDADSLALGSHRFG
jgi:Toprim domain